MSHTSRLLNASLSYRIDWLTASSKSRDIKELLPPWASVKKHKPVKAKYYHAQYDLAPCGRIMISDDARQGSVIHLTGDDITILIELEGSLSAVKSIMYDALYKSTRIDFALDIANSGGLVTDIGDAWEENKCKTRVRTPPKEIKERDENGGSGVQIGSRGKKVQRRLKVYDKAADLGILADILRIELTTLGEAARRMEADMFTYGVLPAGRRHLVNYFDIPDLDWWQFAVDGGEDFPITKGKRKEPNPDAFLNGVVIPFIEKNMDDHQGLIEMFHRKVGQIIKKKNSDLH